MKYNLLISSIILMLCAFPGITKAQPLGTNQVSTANVSYIDVFSFGGVGFGGMPCEGEKLFNKISTRRDALEQFVNLYGLAQGNDQAKMYAMVGFYYLNRSLYNHIKANYKNQKIMIKTANGCLYEAEYLSEILKQLESGYFQEQVPKAWLRKSPHNRSAWREK